MVLLQCTSKRPLLLYRTAHNAVRSWLSQKHPQLFGLPAMHAGRSDASFAPSEQALKTLASLNGYSKVSTIQCPVTLAEGVHAVQRGKLLDRFTIYARESLQDISPPIPKTNISPAVSVRVDNNSEPTQTYFPPFREEDFTVYRNIENRLDTYINSKKKAWMKYFRSNSVVRMLKRITLQLMRYKTEEDSDFLLESLSDEKQVAGVLCTESNSTTAHQHEDLLIFYQGNLVALEHVHPEYRLLALPRVTTRSPQLPYKLKHNTASTIIYVSLSTFVALPLAYRSIKYALDYPALVELLLASFFGTLAYSIWYSRYGARVRQRLSIEKAVGSRIVARNDAATALLVEGAVTNVTQLVLAELGNKEPAYYKEILKTMDPNKRYAADIIAKALRDLDVEPAEIAHEIEIDQ